jgi:FkbM family methyltransferase
VLSAFADAYPEATFVEIGSNDGDQYDHLRPYIEASRWRGVMVEPVPHVFARLERNYGELERVNLEPAAISTEDGEVSVYYVGPADPAEHAPGWWDAIGSLSRDQVIASGGPIPDLENRIRSATVPSLTFASLCAKHGLDKVDLLLVDTEGHDLEILSSIDFEHHQPRLVVYENFHLSPADRAAAKSLLEGFGYATMDEWLDTWALQTSVDDDLSRIWQEVVR